MRQFKSDDEERRKWQDPETIFSMIGLKPGMTFIDIGCNEGYFAIPAARRVGPSGKVYGVDINAEAIDSLRNQAGIMALHNMELAAGEAEDTVFCQACADIVFYGIDLHDFRDPGKVLANARQMLKPRGLLVDLDWKDRQMDIGPPLEKRFSVEKATNMIRTAGFTIQSSGDAGPYHYLLVARLP
jgi:ubiquinone/menaquinone biosynthesis C-methylase UbiE